MDIQKLIEQFGNNKAGRIAKTLERNNLSEDDRILVSLSCQQAENDIENLTGLLNCYLIDKNNYLKAYEVLLQGYLFCGYPRAIDSFFCLGDVLGAERDEIKARIDPVLLSDSETLLSAGYDLAEKVHGAKMRLINNKISEFSPDLGYLMIAEGYGHILSRKGLDIRQRELAVLGSLTALSAKRQLNSHIRGARNVGCSEKEIYEAIATCSLWLPPDKVMVALELWSKITDNTVDEKF